MRWLRLFHGRLWHAGRTLTLAYCGEWVPDPSSESDQPEIADTPPLNAWVCERCVLTLTRHAADARRALDRDPRRTGDTVPVDQTILADDPERPGNCFAACIATAVGRPLEDVPHFVEWGQWLHNERRKDTEDPDRHLWWAMTLGYVAGLGLWPVPLDAIEDAEPDELVFVGGPSPRGVEHQVLYRNGALWHDPHPSRAGLLSIDETDLWVLRPSRHDHTPTSASADDERTTP